jgi:enoyl-CoA hydratase
MLPKYKYILLSIRDGIARITLNRPDKRNAMNSDVLREIDSALDAILSARRNKETQARVVIFGGSGDHFTGGADIKEMRDLDPVKAYEFARLGQYIGKKFERYPLPVIAVIQGYCVGGGVELTSACDMRIAAKDAIFGQPEINIGIVTGWGSSQRLPRIVGISKAKELMYTGRMINADEAHRIHLVDMVVPRNRLEATAVQIADEIKVKPAAAIAAAKETVLQASMLPLDEGLEFERKSFGALFGTFDQKEAMSAFLEKRKANFKDTIDDFFNLDKFPWKSDIPEDRKRTPEPPKSPNPLPKNPFLEMGMGTKNPLLDMEDAYFGPTNTFVREWYEMQKMSASIIQKQSEIVLGQLMDFSKMVPKWMK